MKASPLKKSLIILAHGLAIWILCGATIGIGRKILPMPTVLVIHAILAPLFAAAVSILYFKKFHFTSPFMTALFFLALVMVLDAGLVAPLFERSFAMFRSALGTWIPFALIFLATFFTGLLSDGRTAK
jgi:hypothetical protein